MKRMFALILTMAMLLSMAACGGEAAPPEEVRGSECRL